MTSTRNTTPDPALSLEIYARDALDALAVIAWVMDAATWRFQWVSRGAERVLGCKVNEWLDQPHFWEEHLHPDDRPGAIEFCRQQTDRLRDHEFEYRMIAADGRAVWIRDLVRVSTGPDGKAKTLSGVMFDITAAKETEAALHASEERFAFFSKVTHEGVFVYDDGVISDVNDAGARLVGFSTQDLIGRRMEELVPAGDRERVQAQIAAGDDAPSRGFALRKDGIALPIEVRARDIPHGASNIRVAIVRDLTEQVQAEEALREAEDQLRQSQRLEALGQLAGGIAHDFNNLLTVISAYTQMLLSKAHPADSSHSDLSEVYRAATRAGELTKQLLAFSRKQVLQPAVHDLNGIVESFSQMITRLLPSQIELRLNLADRPVTVRIDPGQMEQVLMNLAVNARDAMEHGGQLEFRTRVIRLDQSFSKRYVGVDVAPGEYVELTASDSGVGMSEETRSRAFEPFFTTKRFGEGTGLGLATVYGIVKQSGGYISVDSSPGRGTSFRLYFPLVSPERQRGSSEAAERSQTGSETVLVVDDEPAIREIARRSLSLQGYTVRVADSASSAITQLRGADGTRIALVVTDVQMPNGSGREVADAVEEMGLDSPVLFISGFPNENGLIVAGQQRRSILAKPFTPEQLTSRVRQMLDDARTGGSGKEPASQHEPD